MRSYFIWLQVCVNWRDHDATPSVQDCLRHSANVLDARMQTLSIPPYQKKYTDRVRPLVSLSQTLQQTMMNGRRIIIEVTFVVHTQRTLTVQYCINF